MAGPARTAAAPTALLSERVLKHLGRSLPPGDVLLPSLGQTSPSDGAPGTSGRSPAPGGVPFPASRAARTAASAPSPKLLARLRQALPVRHYSRRTEEAYVLWVRRFVVFHRMRHPSELGDAEISAFLTDLAVAACTAYAIGV